jgi:hypothetical protein
VLFLAEYNGLPSFFAQLESFEFESCYLLLAFEMQIFISCKYNINVHILLLAITGGYCSVSDEGLARKLFIV